jgi:hypothetical protein
VELRANTIGCVLAPGATVLDIVPAGEPLVIEARIRIAPEANKDIRLLALYPGIPAEVMIVTGRRTVLSYIAAPLTASLNRAFRPE